MKELLLACLDKEQNRLGRLLEITSEDEVISACQTREEQVEYIARVLSVGYKEKHLDPFCSSKLERNWDCYLRNIDESVRTIEGYRRLIAALE